VDCSHLAGVEWRSSKCDAGACVEFAELDAVVLIRDSADPGTSLAFGHDLWRDFVSRVRAGAFDV
jgi:hypothetical protein